MGLKIGEVAALAGVPTPTVRYYERRGLIPRPPRSGSGYRQYGPETAERLQFIKRAQELGFTLEEIEELLALRVDDPAACAVVESQTRGKLSDIRGKIAELRRLEAVLLRLAETCAARKRTSECPVLEMLLLEEVSDA